MKKEITQQILEANWDEDANGKKWEDYETIVCPNGKVIDMVNVIEEIYRSVAALTHMAPMFGGFTSKLRFIYTFRVQTMATDGFNLFINPQFADELDFTGKVFVLAHEVMHCLLNHMRRAKIAGHTDHMRSNTAADYEVNITLTDIGLFKDATVKKLQGLYDPKYKGMGYEKIYDMVGAEKSDSMDNSDESKDAENNQDKSDNSSQDSAGSGSGQSPEYSDDYKAGWAQAIEDYKAGKIKV